MLKLKECSLTPEANATSQIYGKGSECVPKFNGYLLCLEIFTWSPASQEFLFRLAAFFKICFAQSFGQSNHHDNEPESTITALLPKQLNGTQP